MVSPSSCWWALPCCTASSLGHTSNSGAGFKGPSAGLVALVSWGIKYFYGKCSCGPSGHLGTGLSASLTKLPLWSQACDRRCVPSPQAQLEASVLVKASSDLKGFNKNLGWWSQMTQEQCMQGGAPWLSTAVCALRCGRRSHPIWTSHQIHLWFYLAVRNSWHPRHHQFCCQEMQTVQPCWGCKKGKDREYWHTHMKKIISTASASAQRPHTLSQGLCRTYCEVQEECFCMMLNVLPCLGRETCFVLPFLVCE